MTESPLQAHLGQAQKSLKLPAARQWPASRPQTCLKPPHKLEVQKEIMCKCLLCQQREATKKGSHIVPSFFMKRINSIDGCNERDHELGFSIGLGTIKTYFGRDVYEDRRREFTDDESRIEDRTNLDTMDNVFCPECEILFSKYESKYSQTYYLPFDKELVENNKVTGADAALFW